MHGLVEGPGVDKPEFRSLALVGSQPVALLMDLMDLSSTFLMHPHVPSSTPMWPMRPHALTPVYPHAPMHPCIAEQAAHLRDSRVRGDLPSHTQMQTASCTGSPCPSGKRKCSSECRGAGGMRLKGCGSVLFL